MKPKNRTFTRTIIFFSLLLYACKNGNALEPISSYEDLDVGGGVVTLPDVSLDLENAFFDDFLDGVSYDDWIIGNGAWGNGNGGVVPDNVFYTEDGILLLRGNGEYYAKGEVKGVGTLKDGRNTGSVIITRFQTRPGHYDVKMKPIPRLGACTAFWTYTNRPSSIYSDNDNHEIDIELPGGKTKNAISFKNVLNTNYITEPLNISKDVVIADATGGETINLNDGKFHTFGFDWYTDPEVVIYFIDGKITAITDGFVPTLESRLWLGNWFPNNAGFVGLSQFETDYMMVDWFKYIPFLDQPYESTTVDISVAGASENQYPTNPVVLPEVNPVANGDFEYTTLVEDYTKYGWGFGKLSGYSVDVKDVCYLDVNGGKDNTTGAVIKNGGYLSSAIDCIYEGQKQTLEFDAKTDASQAIAIVRYRDSSGAKLLDERIDLAAGNDFVHYTHEINPPVDTYSVLLQFYSLDTNQVTTYVDNVMITR